MDEIKELNHLPVGSPLSFACSCGEEREQKCAEVKQWAIDWLNRKRTGEEIEVYGANKENLVDRIVTALWWSYRASINGIYTDQWSAISTSTADVDEVDGQYKRREPPTYSTYIQCDDVIDGFAFTLKAYHEKFGDKRER